MFRDKRGFIFPYLNFLDFSFAFYSENRQLSQSDTIKRSRFGEEGTVLIGSLPAVQSQMRQDRTWLSPMQLLPTKRDSGSEATGAHYTKSSLLAKHLGYTLGNQLLQNNILFPFVAMRTFTKNSHYSGLEQHERSYSTSHKPSGS